eukprot:COSAG02_NODE_515_length_20817_cov_61.106960_13_plen_157_part_00
MHGVTYGVNTAFFGSILVPNPSHVSTLNQIVGVGARGRRARPPRRAWNSCCLADLGVPILPLASSFVTSVSWVSAILGMSPYRADSDSPRPAVKSQGRHRGLRSTQTSTPHRISEVGGAHLEPHDGVWRVRRRALPKAGRETVKRFGVSQTLDKPG